LDYATDDPREVFEAFHSSIHEAIRALVKARDWRQSARRLVDILVAGARPSNERHGLPLL
jgi:hypothetical protein